MAKPGRGFSGGFAEFQRQAMRIQRKLDVMQEDLKERRLEAAAGGGKVKAVVSGGKELLTVEIDPEMIKPEEREMLQDLVVSAVNAALRQVDDLVERETQEITGGLKIPGLT